ncbi:MAG: LytTR family DNA-binding domain-containing protein [Bacteroidia bacterium]|nr:LytTR family DNA-binding domain-containing protein [Bacteroidia bacterium]
MNAVIIDDNKNNRGLLRTLVEEYSPEVIICGEAADITEGQRLLDQQNVDLVFLDIELKDGNGLDLLKKAKGDFVTIVTTSYKEYAFDAYQEGIIDYLIKPIEIDRLISAINRASILLNTQLHINSPSHQASSTPDTILISERNNSIFIRTEDVIYLEADGKYTNIICSGDRRFVSSQNLKEFELSLGNLFIRVHHSYIVNLKYCASFNKGEHMLNTIQGYSIPVSLRKKDVLLSRFPQF